MMEVNPVIHTERKPVESEVKHMQHAAVVVVVVVAVVGVGGIVQSCPPGGPSSGYSPSPFAA
jgi:hypothetical protein